MLHADEGLGKDDGKRDALGRTEMLERKPASWSFMFSETAVQGAVTARFKAS